MRLFNLMPEMVEAESVFLQTDLETNLAYSLSGLLNT